MGYDKDYKGDNIVTQSFLDDKTFKDIKFDVIVGNPPYQSTSNNKGKGNTLWDKFVEKSIISLLIINGYLLFVHPKGWRQHNHKTGYLMKSKQILYLNMNNLEAGKKVFKSSTDFDYYVIKNTAVYEKTVINDYKNQIYDIMINENIKFIPNHSIDEVYKLCCFDNNYSNSIFINDQSLYEIRKKWMSKNKILNFTNPCVYSISSTNTISYTWSSENNRGHFGVSKFVFSNGCGYIKDLDGIYGLSQWAYAFKCDESNMDYIEKVFNSNKFKNIIDAIQLTSNKYNYSIIKIFKQDFLTDFLL